MPVKITTESASDLSREMLSEFGVTVIPMNIIVDGKEYKDGETLTSRQMLAMDKTAKTAAVNTEEYKAVFSSLRNQGYDIVHVALSSGISSTYNNAVNAAKNFDNVYVVDSLSLSAGAGFLCVIAAQLASSGESAVDIVRVLEKKRDKIRTSFVLEDLEHMKRGGRCTAIEALGANFLGIRPSIELTDGKLRAAKKFHGKPPAARLRYIDFKITSDDPDRTVCFMNHTLESEEEIEELRDLLGTKYGFERVFVNRAGCCIAAHCGKNCMGVIYAK